MIAQSVATDEETSAGYAQAFEDLGADELVWMPCSDDLDRSSCSRAPLGSAWPSGAVSRPRGRARPRALLASP